MKKNFTIKKILVATAVSTALLSMTAIAGESNEVVASKLVNATATESNKSEESKEVKEYGTVSGKVSSITDVGDYTRIEITNADMGMVFNIEDAKVIDQSTSTYKNISDIKVGMEITAVLPNNSPMTMSLPPQTSSAKLFVINSEAGSVDLSVYNEELINAENTLKLNVSEDTIINDLRGSKKEFTEKDLENKELLVLYSVATRSIPAQTNPEMVVILTVDEEIEETNETQSKEDDKTETKEVPAEEVEEAKEIKNVTLRSECEALGYTVKWTSNDEAVIIEKDGMTAEVKLGSDKVKVNNEEKTIANAPSLDKDTMVISNDFVDMLK